MHRPYKFDPPWIDFFTRPCPWFTKQLTSFPQFSRLPKELQLVIWELAEPCRQVVSLSCPSVSWMALSRRGDPAPEIYLQYRRPGMRKACFDARVAGLKHFPSTPAFKSYLPSPVRFNFDRDVLELDMHMMEWIATVHEEQRIPLVEPPMVKNLAVSHYRPFRLEDLVLICQYFTGLDVLMLHEPELGSNQLPSKGMLHDLSPKQACRIPRYRWIEILRPIRSAIPGVRPWLHKWVPPTLTTGTVTQWARLALTPRALRRRDPEEDREPNMMDWSPTLSIPSLEYSPRLELPSGQISNISAGHKEAVKWAWEYDSSLEVAIMKSWVFENAALKLFNIDGRKVKDIDSLSWPGRDKIKVFSEGALYL
ncbi:hypothetical protein VTL71DRAFT_10366 [Oculimacula yallundae]|uniref:2EXR domain-containing protein n=1 Tax=Oculimacula yallundae TaxID=86028 RepID=A0ABR4CTC3_9HELO